MDEATAMRGLEAAGRLAAISPQIRARMTEWNFEGLPPGLWTSSAFRQIGRAIGSRRHPLPDRDLKRVFAEVEKLLRSPDHHVANADATDLLEEVWNAAHHGGFDFSTVDPHLGAEARSYLIHSDEFNRTTTPGLRRR